MLNFEEQTAEAWNAYGVHHTARGTDVPDVDRFAWGYWPAGPAEEILGDLEGRRVLDIGSGVGKYPAHLARLGFEVDAVEASLAQHERAVARYGQLPGLRLIHSDAVAHLTEAEPYDVIYSVRAMPYIDPRRLLPALVPALKPGGRLVFSSLLTNSSGNPPSTWVTARPEILPVAGGEPLFVHMWVLTPQHWTALLIDHGLGVDQIDVLTDPDGESPLSCTLTQARRR
ncbi:hypothetical protein GCM10010271_64710 [Streptomyces kurssanovii]|nr:hypothetical protein GCM10010271_64710 [Streptomyces kurssanovii]